MKYKYYVEKKMDQYKRCPRCGKPIKQIPIRRLGSVFAIELYCERCDESITIYTKSGKIKFEHAQFF